MKENHHDLTDKEFEEYANKTDQYSASDISILVRDAVYEPIRRLQLATKFKKTQEGKWTPCREGEDG